MIFTLFTYALAVTVGIVYGIWAGKKSGIALENARCYGFCIDLFHEGKLSPSARRVMHSIGSYRKSLIPEEAFWGESGSE